MRFWEKLPGAGWAWILAGTLWLWTFWACAGEWRTNESYSYGFFVPFLTGYFFWRRWPELGSVALPKREVGWAWGLLGLVVLAVGPVELVRQTPLYWRPVLWAMGLLAAGTTLIAAFLSSGRAGVHAMMFVSLFPLIGIPWPGQVEIGTTVALQGWVATATGEILNWFGVAAVVDGKTIRVGQCVLGVEEACSGLQSLQSSLMVALAGGEVFRRSGRTRLVLVAWATGVALIGNLGRAVLLGWIGSQAGPARVDFWHNLLGMGILLAVVLVVWRTASHGKGLEIPKVAKRVAIPSRPGRWEGILALGWVLISGILVHLWYARPQVTGLESLLEPAAGAVRENVPTEVAGVLRATEGFYVRGPSTVGYHFWWDPSRGNANQLYHRPDLCMPGAGWRQSGPTREMIVPFYGHDTVWTVFPYERPGQLAVLLWAVWLDGEPVRLRAYDNNRQVYLQKELLAEFIRRGKRIFSFEVAACLIPGADVDPLEAGRCLEQMFRWRDGVRKPAPVGSNQ